VVYHRDDPAGTLYLAVDALLVHILADRVAELTDRLLDALYTPAPRRVTTLIETLATATETKPAPPQSHSPRMTSQASPALRV
jgi:hypothetical protein